MSTPLVISALFLFGWGQAPTEPLGVCQVLQHLGALDGRSVVVRGVWRIGDADQDLVPPTPCEHATVRDGWKWSDSIDVGIVHWDNSPDSLTARYFRIRKEHPEGVKIVATLSGRLETRDHFKVRKYFRGPDLPVAFGYSVARLALLEATDLEAVPYGPGEQEAESERDKHPYPVRLSKQ